MKLFRKEIIDKKTRSRYDVNGIENELSKKLFNLKGIKLDEVIVKLEPDEMMPHEEIKVSNMKDFEKTTRGKNISSVKFIGKYRGSDLKIVIDYGLSLLNILSKNEQTNEDIKDALSK